MNRKKDRTVFKPSYNGKERNFNIIVPEEASYTAFETHHHIFIGPSNIGKSYYMLKILGTKNNKRPINMKNRSLNQFSNYKSRNEFKPTDFKPTAW